MDNKTISAILSEIGDIYVQNFSSKIKHLRCNISQKYYVFISGGNIMKSIAKILTNLTGIITFIVLVSHSAVYTQDKLEGVSVVNIECRIIACDTSFLKDAGIKTKGRSTIINDKAVEDMLRLLKGGKGEAIANYKLALFNEKKDNVSLLKQIAYVSGYEDAIDPIIDVINEGIVVEMCPNISNDRKYINLEVSTEIRE